MPTLQEYGIKVSLQDSFSGALEKTTAKAEAKLNGLSGKTDRTFQKITQIAERFGFKNSAMMQTLADNVPALGGSISSLVNPYTAAAAAASALGVVSYNAASSWNKGMAEVNVTAQLTKAELSGLSDKILSIAENSYTPLQQVPQAFNRIISAGLDANTALSALKPTLDAAKAGFTDAETAATAAVSVMNSAGIKDATRVYDVLFATLNKGNANFNDIAQYLPKIIPQALLVGSSLEQVAGSFAYMTAKGQTAENSTTLLQNVFRAISNPERIEAFNKLGVAVFDSKGKMLPLVEIAAQLDTKLAGLSDKARIFKLSSLGMDTEAANGFAALSMNVKDLSSSIDFAKNSQGQLAKSLENSLTTSDRWLLVKNKLYGAATRLGQYIVPVVDRIASGVLWVIELFQDWAKGVDNVTKPIQWLFSKTMGMFDSMMGKGEGVKNMFESIANAVKAIISPLAFITGKIDALTGKRSEISNKFIELNSSVFTKAQELVAAGKNTEARDFIWNNLSEKQRKFGLSIFDEKMKSGGFNTIADMTGATTTEGSYAGFDLSGASGGKKGKGVSSIFDGGSSDKAQNLVRNISMTINKMVGAETIIIQNGEPELRYKMEKILLEILTKPTRDVQIAMGQ